jgi:large subunit ribosomal protein L13e
LKEAGLGRKKALGLGVIVDHRRRNLSEEGRDINVARLKAYLERLIIFPRKSGKPKKGDSTVSTSSDRRSKVELISISQGDDLTAETSRTQVALADPYVHEAPRKITDEEREFQAYRALREGRAAARHEGKRKARQAKVRILPPPRMQC